MSRISAIVAAADDTQKELVPITAWGVEVEVRGMDLTDRSDYIRAVVKAQEEEDEEALRRLDAELVVATTFDPEDGSKVFTDSDVPMLLTKAAAVIAPLSRKAQRLSGLDAEAEERLGKGFSALATTVVLEPAPIPNVVSSSPSPESLG